METRRRVKRTHGEQVRSELEHALRRFLASQPRPQPAKPPEGGTVVTRDAERPRTK